MKHWFAPNWVAKRSLQAHFPFALMALVGALLVANWRAPAVLLMLLAIVMLPLIYASDASKLQAREAEIDR